MLSWKTASLFAALCPYPPITQAYDPNSGSAVAGDLSSIAGPYGIPADKYESLTNSADASAAFNITGYNVSADSSNSPVAVSGWKLTARVKTDVSLSDSTDNSSSSSSQKTEATTLYLEAPDGMTMGSSWRMCAVVYTGTASAVANTTTVDGTCNGVLSSECIQALTASAGSSENTGMDNSGNCTDFVLPSRCTDDFPDGSGNNSAISKYSNFGARSAMYRLYNALGGKISMVLYCIDLSFLDINQTILDNKRFYTYASDPTSSDNSTAKIEAKDNVWPVITIFGHVSSGGELSSANTAVQCVRAINGTAGDDIGSSAMSGFQGMPSLFVVIGLAVLTSLLSMA